MHSKKVWRQPSKNCSLKLHKKGKSTHRRRLMSRYRGLVIVAVLALLVSTFFLQHGEAQRGRKAQKPEAPDTDVVQQGSSRIQAKPVQTAKPSGPAPVSARAVNFAVSDAVRDLPDAPQIVSDAQAQG